jgi:hypothetical protein
VRAGAGQPRAPSPARQIDGVAVWNTARTATQVSAIYSSACNILTASDSETIQVTDYATAVPINGVTVQIVINAVLGLGCAI